MSRQRLQKLMAACGVGSRRACEEMIEQGRVEVDGTIVTTLGTQVDLETQSVKCDGNVLRPEPMHYYLLNKPGGAICSMVSKAGRPRAVDYLPGKVRDRRIFTIGRLDVDSEGAIILTNDGELCHLVTHPRFGITKSYEVEVKGSPTQETIEKMRKGVWLAEGRTGKVNVKVLRRSRERALLGMTLQEGKRREIRRICARFGHEVRRLIRVKVGPVDLEDLPTGRTRVLTKDEIESLRKSANVVIRLGGAPPKSQGGRGRGGSRKPLKRERATGGKPRASAGPRKKKKPTRGQRDKTGPAAPGGLQGGRQGGRLSRRGRRPR
jgi:23S rRNA pseudouridine2605 synthase